MKITKLLILTGLLIAGCSHLSKNRTVFNNPVCQPPCWQNITPGVTTKDDALVILSKIDFIDQSQIDMHRPSLGFDDEIRFLAYKYHPTSGSIFISGDHISMIAFESNLGTTVQRAIDLFGTPETILLVRTSYFDQITL